MRFSRMVILVLTLIAAVACTSLPPTPQVVVSVATIESPLATPAAASVDSTPTPQLAPGTVSGSIVRLQGAAASPIPGIGVRLGRVFWNADKTDGAFVFEGATSPSTVTSADGSFAFTDVAPGDYVILVGDLLADHRIMAEDSGKAKIYSVAEGQPLDVGQLEVDL